LYASEAKISDQKFVDSLISDTRAMSIGVRGKKYLYTVLQPNPTSQNSILSSIIAGFLQQASQALQPNNNQETVCLLSQLVPQGNSTQQSSQFCLGPYPGEPSKTLIRANILLVTSFFLAIMIVLACGLIHQWCDTYMKNAYPRTAPHKRGRVRTYLFQGFNQFHMRNVMYSVRVVLVASVILFACGVSDYLSTLYPTVGRYSWSCVIAAGVAYAALTIFPLIIGNCPYRTALTTPLQYCRTLLFSGRAVWPWFRHSKEGPSSCHKVRRFDENPFLVNEVDKKAGKLDLYAMEWLITDDDFSDVDMDKFLEGLPGYIRSPITQAVKEELPKVLTAPYVLGRIGEHLLSCVTAAEPSEDARVARVSACVESLRVILQTSAERLKNPNEEESLRKYIQGIVDDLNALCGEPKEKMDLRAFCVRALAFQGILTKCLESALVGSSVVNLPSYFIPLYDFFSSHASPTQLQDPGPPPAHVSREKSPANSDTRWQVLLHDGSFVNLSLLAKAILSHDETVDSSSLSMCWKTLDMLRSEFRITRTKVSRVASLKLFDDTHKEIRKRVETEEPGFSVRPLLEILDAVDGGRRLSMVFRDHPNTKYHGKSDLVFGTDRLRNPDLFRAFAHCLPQFVTDHPGSVVELMEGLVLRDHLWTSLQAHLANSLQPNSSVQAMLHVFEMCCTVIDVAFVALENSEVDWRAPDFGSLAHYFELFVTDCFQGIFIERAIAFRVGLIKAQFCNAVLAQFVREFREKDTVVFRSHWDVASLARVFYSLGIGDSEGMNFWEPFVDGGPIGPDFMATTHTTLRVAERDGPLLNFCKLGRLAMMAVPFKGSGLEHTDFKKLLDVMQKMTEASDSHLSLTRASTPVWEHLYQLRYKVSDICEKSSNKDEENMKALLKRIDAAYPSSEQGRHLVTSGAPVRSNDEPGHSSTPTAFIKDPPLDPPDNFPAQEVDTRGMVFPS
jgi:hypothetical protein